MSEAEDHSFLPKEQDARIEIYQEGERTPHSKTKDWWVSCCGLNFLILVLLYFGYRFNQILEEKEVLSAKLMSNGDAYSASLQEMFSKSTTLFEKRISELVDKINTIGIDTDEIDNAVEEDLLEIDRLFQNPFNNNLDPRDEDDGPHAFVQFVMKPDQILRPLITARVLQKVNTKAEHVIVTIRRSQDAADKNSYAKKICKELGYQHVDLDPKDLEKALENCPQCPLEKYLALLGYGFTEYSKVAVLGDSYFPISNIDDVFKFRSPAAACSENNWFEMKSGILVVRPSEAVLHSILTALHEFKRVPDSGFLAEDEDGWGDKDGGSSFLSSWLEYNHTQWARLHPGWDYPWDKIKTGGSWYYFVWRKKALRAVDFQKEFTPWRDVNGNRLGDYDRDKHATGRMTVSMILKLWWNTLYDLVKEHPVIEQVLEESSQKLSKKWFELALVPSDIGYPELPPWPLDLAEDKHINWVTWDRKTGKSG